MHLTRALGRNLNTRHWNRRIWEVGYRGAILPQQKATGRPDFPVSANRVNILRERLAREQIVMNLLTRPYSSVEAELTYLKTQKNVNSLDELRAEEFKTLEAKRMPGKPKNTEGSKATIRKRANVGNLLHSHTTVEDSLAALAERKRWD
uniref:Transposase n=1 Tax=Caenorhabditis tropicalis TaxID=1561998 RepID=A0A1I7TBC9_9PELO